MESDIHTEEKMLWNATEGADGRRGCGQGAGGGCVREVGRQKGVAEPK